jgi:hypothetical protein
MPALESLRIHRHRLFREPIFRQEGMVMLFLSPHFPALRELHLRGHAMDDDDCEALAESGILRRLRVLDLSHGTISDRGVSALARCRDISGLELLDLSFNLIGERGVRRMEALPIEVNCEEQGHERLFPDHDWE